MTVPPPRSITPPARNPETAHFWDACNEGRLLLRRCKSCGEAHYYPRPICPLCHSDDTVWEEADGHGQIYSVSVMSRTASPFALAYVTLREKVTMLTNIVDCDLSTIEIGQQVVVTFKPADDGQMVPMFKPAGL